MGLSPSADLSLFTTFTLLRVAREDLLVSQWPVNAIYTSLSISGILKSSSRNIVIHHTLQSPKFDKGFTIVELLIVVVVVGILAAILAIAFSGVSRQATIATMLSDLSGASKRLSADQVLEGDFPSSVEAASGGNGLQPSDGTTYQYTVNNSSNPKTFCLTATNGSIAYYVTQNTPPTEGTCPGHTAPSALASDWRMISIGNEHSCAIGANQRAYCWGGNANGGELGDNSSTDRFSPVPVYSSGVLNGISILQISSGFYHTCAVGSNSQAYCWGNGQYGRLGNNATANSSVPVAVSTSGALSGLGVTSIAAGQAHTCGIASNSQAYCWGLGVEGRLGNNSSSDSSVPVAVDTSGVLSGKTILKISTSYNHTCAIASDNQVYCWGDGALGRLGNNSTSDSLVPVAVSTAGVLSGKTIVSVSAGRDHTCAIDSDGNAYCWGSGANGRLGNNSTSNSLVPVAVSTSGALSGLTVSSISAGYAHTCAIASNGNAYCWGSDSSDQLGNNNATFPASLVPVAVSTAGVMSGRTLIAISAESAHTCAIASEGPAYCWGTGSYGQLGNNADSSSPIPVEVVTPTF